MKYLSAVIWVLALSMALLGAFCVAQPAKAQGTTFPDVPANHWAYQAVTDLANKGYVKGYPDGRFLGGRTLTRFEFATIIDRMAQTLDDLSQKVAANQQVATPTGAPVTQDDLNKIEALVDSFKDQLTAIQSTVATNQAQFQSELDKLRSDLSAVKSEANNSYGAGPGRKYTISGYVQERYITTGSSSEKNFPQGSPTSSSAYNGTYAAGGNASSFVTRYARLRVSGQPTTNASYALQIDASGLANNTPSATSNGSNAAVTVKEAWGAYTLGNGDTSKYPTFMAGQIINPFGYFLPLPHTSRLSPERPLAFNESSAGLFANQDADRGVQLAYTPSLYRFIFAAVNGGGTVSNDESHTIDTIYKAGLHSKDNVLAGDLSYYDGHIAFTKGLGTSYILQKKQLWDADAQIISPAGPFVVGEYLAGTYEQRAFVGEMAGAATNPFGFGAAPAPGNKVKGYDVQAGWTFGATGSHALSLFGAYDVLNRSDSGVSSTEMVAGAPVVGGASGSWFDDVNMGYGLMYYVDKAIRLRFYYDQPYKVAHPQGTAEPPRVGLTTAEVQVKF